jgi:gliding motility-associated-like protein
MKKLILLTVICVFSLPMLAQRAAHRWYFGNFAGMDFNPGAPVKLNNSAMFSSEGCSSVSDSISGSLLFYTNGETIWNANHVPMAGMPPGGIGGQEQSAQSALIVKRPGNNNAYYVISNPFFNPFGGGNLSYSIVNMNLNGGLGGIVSTNNFLMQGTSERISAVRSCDRRATWLVSHEQNGQGFYAWKITTAGFGTPVISNVGPLNPLAVGQIKFAPSRLKVAMTEVSTETWLLDFDPLDGTFSNPIALGVPGYGIEFSPDGTRLYVTQGDTSILWQFDVTAPTASGIIASKTNVSLSTDGYSWGIQNAPNGKMYISKQQENELDALDNPNTLGFGCGYVANAINIGPFTAELGLPNYPIDYISDGLQRTYAKFRFRKCVGPDTAKVEIKDLGNNPTYIWNFGDPGSGINNIDTTSNDYPLHNFSAQGTYTCKVVATGPCGTDSGTVVVSTGELNLSAGPDFDICINDGASIVTTGNGAFQPFVFNWAPNTTGLSCNNCSTPYANPTTTQTYVVTATRNFCQETDTVVVTVRPRPNLIVTPSDTTYCTPGATIQFNAINAQTVTWAPPTGLSCNSCSNPVATPLNNVTYTVTGNNQFNCPTTRTAKITIVPLQVNWVPLLTDTFCIDNNIFLACNVFGAGATFFWDLGDGTIKFGNAINHKYNNSGPFTIRLIAKDTLGCTDTIARNIFIDAKGAPYLQVSDSIICVGELVYFTDSLTPYTRSFSYNFGDGFTNTTIRNPEHLYEAAGIYTVTLTSKQIRCPDANYSITMKVNGNNPPNLGPDTFICPNLTGSISLPPIGSSITGSKFLWNTGATTNFILVQEPGTYWVEVLDGDSSCTAADTIIINRDCYLNIPNAFTPGSNNLNDRFIPMDMLSKGVTSYSCDIFNRWGERVFNTTSLNSSGWDGKYGDKDQPMGTYVYNISVVYRNGKRETYTGNVTLLR